MGLLGLQSDLVGAVGGSLEWIEAALAPLPDIENNVRVYKYGAGDTQYLYALVRVPTSYLAGTQINMKAMFYSPSTSNTVLLTSVATLIQKDATAIDSVTNQRTSTNSAVTNAAPANKPRTVTLDLTSSTGQINAVSVAAGDLILVQLTRGSDSDTANARFLPFATEVTFS
jgi:hypothetical protein